MFHKVFLLSTFFVFASASSYLLPDTVVFRHCIGPLCPRISFPIRLESDDTSNKTADCSSGNNRVIPDPSNCQIYYACRNGSAIKYTCSLGYAFHPRYKLCLPETMVKSCGKVYCPPTVLVGYVPDPKNCSRYYRCIYNLPIHYQCASGSVYDEESGRCKTYDSPPECLVGKGNLTTTVRPTELPEISTTLNSTEVPDISTTLNSTEVPEISTTLNSTEIPEISSTVSLTTEIPEMSTPVSTSTVIPSTPGEFSTPSFSPEDVTTAVPVPVEIGSE